MTTTDIVNERYSAAAKKYENMLCCPAKSYDPKYLKAIPAEVIERDYGCGDPSPYVKAGDTVLDLGSGGGKLCFIAAQIAGPSGRVIGVDMNDDMLALARGAAPKVAEQLGYSNTEFRKGRIEDLGLNLEALDKYLAKEPARNWADIELTNQVIENLRAEAPLVEPNSIDVVVSNCVLNLVSPQLKKKLFSEIHRVLKPGGRAVISDVISDEAVPEHLQKDATLWSGCYSGAMVEHEFLDAFTEAGLYGVKVLARSSEPYFEMEGIELRTVTIVAYKGKEGPCMECNQAVIYKGPFKSVVDDDGHEFQRGRPIAVCEKTFRIMTREPYASYFEPVHPKVAIPASEAAPFICTEHTRVRDPGETKSGATPEPRRTSSRSACC